MPGYGIDLRPDRGRLAVDVDVVLVGNEAPHVPRARRDDENVGGVVHVVDTGADPDVDQRQR